MKYAQETPREDMSAQFHEATGAPNAVHEGLSPNIEYRVDTNFSLAHDERYKCDIAAMITTDKGTPEELAEAGATPDSFLLLDLRKNQIVQTGDRKLRIFGNTGFDPNVEFLLVSKDFNNTTNRGMKGIRRGEKVTIGRQNTDRFDLQSTTSSVHFTIDYKEDGILTVKDHASTNGTGVTTGAPLRKVHQWQTKEEQEKAFRPPEEAKPNKPSEQNEYGLDDNSQRQLAELARNFSGEMARGEIDLGTMAFMLKHIQQLRTSDVTDDKIWKQIAREIHPDRAPAGSLENARRTALFKALNSVIRR